jgi:hypothetical protein
MSVPAEGPWDSPGEELRVIDEELARLREAAADLRRRIGERWDDLADPVDRASLIEAAEEQEALIAELEARRAGLIGEPGRPKNRGDDHPWAR